MSSFIELVFCSIYFWVSSHMYTFSLSSFPLLDINNFQFHLIRPTSNHCAGWLARCRNEMQEIPRQDDHSLSVSQWPSPLFFRIPGRCWPGCLVGTWKTFCLSSHSWIRCWAREFKFHHLPEVSALLHQYFILFLGESFQNLENVCLELVYTTFSKFLLVDSSKLSFRFYLSV